MVRQILEALRSGRGASAALLIAGAIAAGGALGAATAQSETATDAPREASAAAEASLRSRDEALLDRLAKADSPQAASRIEREILADWTRSGSDTVDLLMQWAAEAMKSKDNKRALDYLDRVVSLDPGFAEGWNRRATVYYLLDDYGNSLNDIGHVLALQPRHFGALNGLGLVLDDLDEDGEALAAFRRALQVHPYLDGAQKRIEKLTKEVEGLPI